MIKRTTSDEVVVERRRKRGVAIKLGLGALALVGIGAAVTSAAWSDDANFKADASSATVQLIAWNANNGTCSAAPPATYAAGPCWLDANDAAGGVTITDPGAILTNLVPSQPTTQAPTTPVDKAVTTTLYLYNAGTSKLNVTATCAGTGNLFDNPKAAAPNRDDPLRVGLGSPTVQACSAWSATVNPSTQLSVKLTVTVPGTWWTNGTYKGLTGSLPVVFTGAAT